MDFLQYILSLQTPYEIIEYCKRNDFIKEIAKQNNTYISTYILRQLGYTIFEDVDVNKVILSFFENHFQIILQDSHVKKLVKINKKNFKFILKNHRKLYTDIIEPISKNDTLESKSNNLSGIISNDFLNTLNDTKCCFDKDFNKSMLILESKNNNETYLHHRDFSVNIKKCLENDTIDFIIISIVQNIHGTHIIINKINKTL